MRSRHIAAVPLAAASGTAKTPAASIAAGPAQIVPLFAITGTYVFSGSTSDKVHIMNETIMLDSCPSCGCVERQRLPTPGHWVSEALSSSVEAEKWGLERCRECGLVFNNPRPSDAVLNTFYSTPGYKPHDGGTFQSPTISYLLSRIELHHPGLNSSGEFLDFGCGGGALLSEAVRLGWSVNGYDISPVAIQACRVKGLAVQADIARIPSPMDAILMCHSLEHVSDFSGTLTAVVRALKPDTGRLFVAVPNARSLRAILSPWVLSRHAGVNERYAAFPIHLSHFTARSLKQLLASYGLECTAMETYAFGIDSYFRIWDDTGSTESAPAVVKQHRNSAIKRLVKSAFFGTGLGENLLGIFRRRP